MRRGEASKEGPGYHTMINDVLYRLIYNVSKETGWCRVKNTALLKLEKKLGGTELILYIYIVL